MNLKGMGRESIDWIRLSQNSDKWWGFVNMVMSRLVTRNPGNFLTA